jgi:hypothetical protein
MSQISGKKWESFAIENRQPNLIPCRLILKIQSTLIDSQGRFFGGFAE